MRNLILFSILFLFLCINKRVIASPLSKDAKISIITCSPGTELYSLFGHTAIRIQDPVKNLDEVYNYGTFDFNTPNFYLKYAKGLLPYQLSKVSFHYFLYAYEQEERSVYSQILRLDSIEKQHLYDLIQENYQPKNRSYLYNFLFDNCTTRSRDIVLKSISSEVNWNGTNKQKNFWNLLDEYLHVSPWVEWGIHTILGQGGNQEASTFEYMFLPDYLMYGFEKAVANNQLIVEKTEILYQAPNTEYTKKWYIHPTFILAVGMIILILLLQKFHSPGFLTTIATPFFLFCGLLGCLIVFLGAFTAHPITAPNWNILWANPLNLLVIPFMWRKTLPSWVSIYLKIYMALLTVAIPVWIIAQPAVPGASISIILFMMYLSLRLRSTKKL